MKKEVITYIKADLEPLIEEANEIVASFGHDIIFELHFAVNIKDEGFGWETTAVDELL